MNRNTDPASGRASALGVDHAAPSMTIFKTCPKPCRWKVCADVGAFCRKGLRSPAATRQVSTPKSCRRRSQHRFLLCHATSRFRFALRQIGKSFPAERTYRKLPTRSEAANCFSQLARAAATGTGFLNKCLELRLEWLASPQPHSAHPSIFYRGIRTHSRSQSLISYAICLRNISDAIRALTQAISRVHYRNDWPADRFHRCWCTATWQRWSRTWKVRRAV